MLHFSLSFRKCAHCKVAERNYCFPFPFDLLHYQGQSTFYGFKTYFFWFNDNRT